VKQKAKNELISKKLKVRLFE